MDFELFSVLAVLELLSLLLVLAHQQSIIIIFPHKNTISTMDDDMMLNITRTAPAKPSLAQSSTSVAKENKRSKYSVKERILRQKAGRPNRRSF